MRHTSVAINKFAEVESWILLPGCGFMFVSADGPV